MKVEIIGYSGHSFVVLDTINDLGIDCIGYYDNVAKLYNPYNLNYLGLEEDKISVYPIFICIGDNRLRRNIREKLGEVKTISFIDPTAIISSKSSISEDSVYIGRSAIINANSQIQSGVIINTNSVVEHDCSIGKYSHIAPSATICGNVKIGENTLVGANSTILPNITIGDNVVIGAGSVITKDIFSNTIVAGNPAIQL